MTVFRDGQGRQRLYIGGVTADEYIPELKLPHPPRILSTVDGRHFRVTPARKVVVKVPYGVFRPMGFRTLRVWDGKLFVTATPGLTGDGAIFEVSKPWSPKHVEFKQVTPSSLSVFETEVFNDHLYAGTGDRTLGYGVYEMRPKGSSYTFEPIVTNGAGRGQTATSVVSMHVFKDELYVGSSGWYNEEQLPVSEIIRIDADGTWQVVAGPPRTIDGVLKVPLSGLGDGFNNIFTAHFWRMTTYKGALVVGTNDWSYLVQTAYPGLDPWLRDSLTQALKGELGFDLWSSCDGRDWSPITRDAFGDDQYDFGARNLVTTPTGLFIGSANHAEGTKVWDYTGPQCTTSPAKTSTTATATAAAARATPAAPRRLLTDVQRGGTVLSWARAAAGSAPVRYRVLRSGYVQAPLSLAAPPVLADGFTAEGQPPVVTAPLVAGSAAVSAPVMTGLRTIGTTTAPVFVDRTAQPGQRYAYQVVAERSSGARSAASNLQVVPDPRPAVTAAQVLRAAGAAPGVSARAVAASAGDARTRAETLRGLARLRRTTAPGSDARELVQRLERRVRYAGLAAREGGR
jgi:hypothetical protein